MALTPASSVAYSPFGDRPVRSALILLAAIVAIRILDVFALRSDEVVGELIVTKLAGLALMGIYLYLIGQPPSSIGFVSRSALKWSGLGVLCMAAALAVGYAAEYGFLLLQGLAPRYYWAPEGFSLLAQPGMSGGWMLAASLLLGNAINSTMEEAFFRGLLLTHLNVRCSALKANLLQAVMFGLWHVVWPLRDYLDGKMPGWVALGLAVGYILLSGLIGFIFGAVLQRTGSLWWPWAAHTFNNSAHNFLHVAVATSLAPTLGLRTAVATLALGGICWMLWRYSPISRLKTPYPLWQRRLEGPH